MPAVISHGSMRHHVRIHFGYGVQVCYNMWARTVGGERLSTDRQLEQLLMRVSAHRLTTSMPSDSTCTTQGHTRFCDEGCFMKLSFGT